MNPRRLGGLALVLVGLGIAYTGYQLSNSFGNQVQSAFEGAPTDSVMLRYVLGAACVGVGAVLAR